MRTIIEAITEAALYSAASIAAGAALVAAYAGVLQVAA